MKCKISSTTNANNNIDSNETQRSLNTQIIGIGAPELKLKIGTYLTGIGGCFKGCYVCVTFVVRASDILKRSHLMCAGRLGSNTGRMLMVGALEQLVHSQMEPCSNQKVSKEEFVCAFKMIICPADKVGIRVRVDFLKGRIVVRARVRVIGLAVWVRVLGLGL